MTKKKRIEEGDLEWVTSRGDSIKLRDMNTSHILNSLKKIRATPEWRSEWAEIFERELTRRGMISTDSDFERKIITDEEKMYFLATSCDYQFLSVSGGSLAEITTLNNRIKEYIENNIFCIPLGDLGKEDFICRMKNLAESPGKSPSIDANRFFKEYEDYLLVNVFSKEWSNFMNIMLGRYGK